VVFRAASQGFAAGEAAVSSGHNPAPRFEANLLDGLDEPVRRYFAHAIRAGAELASGVRLAMSGRIKVGVWLPFTARQECDGRSFAWHARVGVGRVTALTVLDRFAGRAGSTEGRVLGRRRIFHAEGEDTTRSAAGRAALEAVFAPMSLLPQRGVRWSAEDDELIVATWDIGPERPELRVRVADDGAVRSVSALRWGNAGQRDFGYIPCGCEVRSERRFGDLVVPCALTVGWWFGTPRYVPFFEADVLELTPTGGTT
jgi:hypothetical protein